MACWLFKSEPDEYSIADLQRDKTTVWNGIRNYQARNFLRDEVAVGDEVLFYHSSCKPTAVAGLAKVVRGAYPDPSQFDPSSPYYDAKSKPEAPRWVCVDIAFKAAFKQPVTLDRIKATPALSEMLLVKQGRLSIQPVTEDQSKQVQSLAK
ncbi:EVE domain-containing protein [Saccharophagus degradans]|uniref:EVE domain-containing protein n=1 Tax=Saccharophagus degradans TaxID=86304 RepID=A0AAW7X200_9GAMM|nr:EVE domain-containing protein [Saccharophagus degradans]MBU2985422.1 EVE domain-containing protein [Saccharophagus degradans]MDO6421502.1 EVE domain-containing protein [Saccharophagus degradans]MDO6608684.1 EVE domain-containing protein [Saccharophagus degradans]